MSGEAHTAEVVFHLNGRQRRLQVAGDETLLQTLRETFAVTSVRATCGIGVCGTCTVLLDGRAVSACLLLTRQVDRRSIITAEGLVGPGGLDAVQQTFVRAGAYQCSFCIPGMTLTVKACLDEHPDADTETVRHHLSGNLCRCGTYPQILAAVQELVRGGSGE